MTEKPPPYGPQGPYPPQQPQPYPPAAGGGAPYQPQPEPQPQPGVTVVTVGNVPATEKWSWNNIILAAISVCCCTCLGLASLIAAMLAYTDHKVKDFARVRNKQRIAKYTAIAAIVCGCVCFLIIILAGGISA